MVILTIQNKITDFFMILAWLCRFKLIFPVTLFVKLQNNKII